MRREDLKIKNLNNEAQVEEIKKLIDNVTGEGARFLGADLETQMIEFDLYQDFDNVDLTTIQCVLRDHGFEAGEVVPGQTCTVRFNEAEIEVKRE